jgi:hypothetical protein
MTDSPKIDEALRVGGVELAIDWGRKFERELAEANAENARLVRDIEDSVKEIERLNGAISDCSSRQEPKT